MKEDERMKEIVDLVSQTSDSIRKLVKRIETLENEVRQTKEKAAASSAPTTSAPPAKDDFKDLVEFVRNWKRAEEERQQKKESRTRVRTDREIDEAAAEVVSRMLKSVQEEED